VTGAVPWAPSSDEQAVLCLRNRRFCVLLSMAEQAMQLGDHDAAAGIAQLAANYAFPAGVGLFGVMSFSVAQRTRELGIRSALGAGARDIVRHVLGQALWTAGLGITVGLAAAAAGVRLLSSFLYGVAQHDPATFVVVPSIMLLVAIAACLVPARRAATVDPLIALKSR